ncbi:MAG: nucleotidyltransferase substrate binding protein [Fusobacteriaceae bacterium]
MELNVRWKQRFQNFGKALKLLREGVELSRQKEISDLEKEGIVQRFEFTYELAWKTLKDYLEDSGVQYLEKTPRATVKEAFRAGIIKDGEIFIEMAICRNQLSHIYDSNRFEKSLTLIKEKYLPEFEKLHLFFMEKL